MVDSRESKDGGSIKRRRECLSCQKRFSTVEKLLKLDLEVSKSSGEVEVFNLQKIETSLLKACEKRPITLEQIEGILNDIVEDLKKVDSQIIPTSTVGGIVLNNLKKVDEIAFLKYIIVHNDYDTITDFMNEIRDLKDFNGLDYKKITKKA